MDFLFSFLIKSDYVRAEVLAAIRQLIAVGGAILVAHGYADNGMVEAFSGFVMASAGFYLAHIDVKGVDAKVKSALNTPVTEVLEEEETDNLNKAQIVK